MKSTQTNILDMNVNPPEEIRNLGYRSLEYASAFSNLGEPIKLASSGGWLLKRSIPETSCFDAMGLYPLFCCNDWSALSGDLQSVESNIVSIVLVTDPFGNFSLPNLRQIFDQVRVYKKHYVVDLTRSIEANVSKSYRTSARRALRNVRIDLLERPQNALNDWLRLYSHMIDRHKITDFRSFSRESFKNQLATPGAMVFQSSIEGEVVGLDIVIADGNVAYGHLCAFTPDGYKQRATHASRFRIIEHLREMGLDALDFGGVPETDAADSTSGLTSYKQSWCAETVQVYLCCLVCDADIYERLVSRQSIQGASANFFPAYRSVFQAQMK